MSTAIINDSIHLPLLIKDIWDVHAGETGHHPSLLVTHHATFVHQLIGKCTFQTGPCVAVIGFWLI